MESWEGFFQSVAKEYVGAKIESQYRAPVELQKLKLQAQSEYGLPYLEGVAGIPQAPFGGIPPIYLLVGAVVLAAVMLKA